MRHVLVNASGQILGLPCRCGQCDQLEPIDPGQCGHIARDEEMPVGRQLRVNQVTSDNCWCDPTIDWAESLVMHRLDNELQNLLASADLIKEKALNT